MLTSVFLLFFLINILFSLNISNDLIEESEDLATGLLGAGLIVVEDAKGGGEYYMSELTGRENILHPLLDVLKGKTWMCWIVIYVMMYIFKN